MFPPIRLLALIENFELKNTGKQYYKNILNLHKNRIFPKGAEEVPERFISGFQLY